MQGSYLLRSVWIQCREPTLQDLYKDKNAILNTVISVTAPMLGVKHPGKMTLYCHVEMNKYTRKEQEGSGCLLQAPTKLQAASTHIQEPWAHPGCSSTSQDQLLPNELLSTYKKPSGFLFK